MSTDDPALFYAVFSITMLESALFISILIFLIVASLLPEGVIKKCPCGGRGKTPKEKEDDPVLTVHPGTAFNMGSVNREGLVRPLLTPKAGWRETRNRLDRGRGDE